MLRQGEGGHSQRSSSQARRRAHGTPGASRSLASAVEGPTAQRDPASMAKMCCEPISLLSTARRQPLPGGAETRWEGQRGVSRCSEPPGTPAPCPPRGTSSLKEGNHHEPRRGQCPRPQGPRAAPCQSQSFPKDNRNQRLLQFAWDELRRLRVGLGWAGGHGLQEGSNRTQGCSALGSQRAGQARPCPQLLLPNTLV